MQDKRGIGILTQVVYKQLRQEKTPTQEDWNEIVDEAVSLSVAIEKAWDKHQKVLAGLN